MKFAQRLKELRNENDLTQDQLSEKTGLSHGCIAMLELEKRAPSGLTLSVLADFFECSIDYLVGRSEDFGNVTVKKNDGALTPEEQTLVDVFRKLNLKNRMHVSAYAEIRLEQQESGTKFA